MALVSLIGGALLSTRPRAAQKDITLWVFDGTHFRDYHDVLKDPFEQASKQTLEVDLVGARAMDARLAMLFMSPEHARELPDAVEVQIASMGRYLRPPSGEVGFLPLNHYLETSGYRQINSRDSPGRPGWNARLKPDGPIYTFEGKRWIENPARSRPDAWIDRIIPNRLTPSMKDGKIFAVPHDVHPVALAFRDDLFREAGVPLMDDAGRSTVATWQDLQTKCEKFQRYWRGHGKPTRHAIQLPESRANDALSIMLLQRHINLVDTESRIHLDDPKVAQTLAFYVQLVAGDRQIAGEAAAESGMEYRDLAEGNLCALLMPDWKVDSMRQFVPQIAGKMRLIPLPRFDPNDAATATFGGTAIAIPRGCPHPDDAWKLIEFLYLSPQGLADRSKIGILPPLPEQWDRQEYHQPDPFFGGQKALELYATLAERIPPAHVMPVTTMALGTLSYVQSKAVGYVRDHGTRGLEAQCQAWLDDAAVDLQRRIDQARFAPKQ